MCALECRNESISMSVIQHTYHQLALITVGGPWIKAKIDLSFYSVFPFVEMGHRDRVTTALLEKGSMCLYRRATLHCEHVRKG